jgi:hypothetical protein
MRRNALTTTSAISMLALLLSASAGAAHSPHPASEKCRRGRGHTIVANARAQLYEAENKLSEHEIYGCAYGGRQVYGLGPLPSGSSSGAGGVEEEVLTGTIAAYEKFSITSNTPNSSGPSSWLVIVRDLRTGRVLHRVPTGTSTSPEDVGGGFTSGIVVKNDGAVAWIVEIRYHPVEFEIHVVDRQGSRILASGTNVDPQSLALAGSTLYWTQGGKPSSTTLN